tara:strand:+ start:156 stop:464 length:309 start_codon:yes stop_codon:yes gene_type:complete
MKILKILLILNLLIFISSCGSVKKAFSNQKKNSSDEFLVEKKLPLVMPPNYNELPLPGKKNLNVKETNEIKSLITESSTDKNEKEKINQNFEESLLEKIKKN